MKICLINPPYANVYKNAKTSTGKTPPITLAYLAAYVRQQGHDVSILDVQNLNISIENIPKYLKNNLEVVGLSSLTPSFNNSVKILEIIKKYNNSCITVMGGPHISAIPQEVMEQTDSLDFGVIGEGEETLAELLTILEKRDNYFDSFKNVPGLVFRYKQNIIINEKRKLIQDLNKLPFPAYDLLDFSIYEQKPHHSWSDKTIKIKPYTNLFTSRGCPHSCTFCASSVLWGRSVRFKSADYVLNEIDLLVNKYGIKSFYICDDTFFADKKRLLVILNKLILKKYDLNFSCMGRVDEIDENLLEALRQSGCHLIRFGVESCCQKILDAMKKGYKVADIRKAFDLCRKVGIPASASIIVGYPGETKNTFEETLKTIKEINPCGCEFFIALPILGTEFYKVASEKNYIKKYDWDKCTLLTGEPGLKTEFLSEKDLINLRQKAFISFYLRPQKLLEITKNIRSLNDVKNYLNGFLTFLNLIKN